LKIGELLFKSRGYTPIPFLLIALIFSNPQKILIIIGIFMILLGEFMRLWGVSYAGSVTRTREAGAPELVSNGPFSYVRNPLYIGNILIYVGAIILSGVWFPYLSILVFLFFYIQYTFIISHEEEKLEELFKESYIEYKKSVPRFVPKMKPFKSKNNNTPQVKKAFISERSTFISMGSFLLLFILRICFIS
jgi:protein-S-isoprenylcysteine O-methyltransferase Ste14